MAAAARRVIDAAGISAQIEERSDSTAAQAGAAFALFADFIGGTRLGADRAGAPHRPAERIGARVARQLLQEMHSRATIGTCSVRPARSAVQPRRSRFVTRGAGQAETARLAMRARNWGP